MGSFLTYLNEDKEDQWLTIHHQHVLVGADGTIKAGFGGKFNGKPVQHAIDTLNAEKSKPSKKATLSKEKAAKPDKPKSKMQHAHDIIKNAPEGALAKDIKKQLADKLGLSPAGASTYYHNIKKKLSTASEKESTPAKKTYKDVVDKVEGKTSKAKQAENIYNQMLGDKSKDVKAAFVEKLGISAATASTYYHNIKKKMGDKPAPEEDNDKVLTKYTKEDVHNIMNDHYSSGKKDTVIHAISKKLGVSIAEAKKHFDTHHSEWANKMASITIPHQSNGFLQGHNSKANVKDFLTTHLFVDNKTADNFMEEHNDTLDHIIGQGKDQQELGAYITQKYKLDKDKADKLADSVRRYKSAQISWSGLNDVFWGIHDKAPKDMSQNEKELRALEIAKEVFRGGDPDDVDVIDIASSIADKMNMPFSDAIVLAHKANKAIDKNEYLKDKPTYYEFKDKLTAKHAGIDVQHNHKHVLIIPDEEHVEKIRSRVTLAKKVNAHQAMDPHDHLVKQYSSEYNRAPKTIQKMSDALYQYTGSTYHYINGALRSQNKEDINNENIKDTITYLDKAFAHKSARIKEDTVVYRGYTSAAVNSLEPGDVFEDRGYMSTTSEEYKAESWAHSGGAVMHILLPKGANVISARPYSQFTSEHEVLLNRGTKVRIIEKVIDHGSITLHAEYVVD